MKLTGSRLLSKHILGVLILGVIFPAMIFFAGLASAMSSTNYRIDAFEINSAGGVSSSESYKLVSSAGEPFSDEGSSENYKLGAGFVNMLENTISFTVAPSRTVSFGDVTPETPVTGYTDLKVRTDAPQFILKTKRADTAGTTMDLISDNSKDIPDRTPWNGVDSATTWGLGEYMLGFTVYASNATKNTTWWGTGTTKDDALNKYAGFPADETTIMQHTGYTSSETTTSVGYKLNVQSTQVSGDYDGEVIYTATMSL